VESVPLFKNAFPGKGVQDKEFFPETRLELPRAVRVSGITATIDVDVNLTLVFRHRTFIAPDGREYRWKIGSKMSEVMSWCLLI
jgi:hypothetical protein